MQVGDEKSKVSFTDVQVASARALAEEDAKRVCAFLKITNRVRLPLEFVTDLAAALRIRAWQKNGLFPFLTSRPELATELSDFIAKSEAGDASWESGNSGPLSRQVFLSWVRNFSWSAPTELGAECLIQISEDVSDDEIAAIAKLLWNLRRSDSRN